MAEALAELGTGRSFVVHGQDGLDEITTTAATDVYEVTAEGSGEAPLEAVGFWGGHARIWIHLKVEILSCNAQIILAILARSSRVLGEMFVLVNAAAGLLAAGLAGTCARAWNWLPDRSIPELRSGSWSCSKRIFPYLSPFSPALRVYQCRRNGRLKVSRPMGPAG